MHPVAHTVHIAAPPERVWQVLVDIARWPEWASNMQSVVPEGSGSFGLGSRARVTPKAFAGAVWEVTEWEPGRSFVWEAQVAPGWRMRATHAVEADGAGTRATASVEATGPLGLMLTALLLLPFRRGVRLESEGLKAYCEGRQRMENG